MGVVLIVVVWSLELLDRVVTMRFVYGRVRLVFGLDLERAVWELVVQTGCELANVLREWRNRENLCERITGHWNTVFEAR